MFNQRFWRLATLLISSYLMFALIPELRMLGFLIYSLGVDTMFLLVGLQIIAVGGIIYRQHFLPIAKGVNYYFEKYDPFFFIPPVQNMKKFPQMAVHSVPFLLTAYVILFSTETINEI